MKDKMALQQLGVLGGGLENRALNWPAFFRCCL